jgi:hypothetical protein
MEKRARDLVKRGHKADLFQDHEEARSRATQLRRLREALAGDRMTKLIDDAWARESGSLQRRASSIWRPSSSAADSASARPAVRRPDRRADSPHLFAEDPLILRTELGTFRAPSARRAYSRVAGSSARPEPEPCRESLARAHDGRRASHERIRGRRHRLGGRRCSCPAACTPANSRRPVLDAERGAFAFDRASAAAGSKRSSNKRLPMGALSAAAGQRRPVGYRARRARPATVWAGEVASLSASREAKERVIAERDGTDRRPVGVTEVASERPCRRPGSPSRAGAGRGMPASSSGRSYSKRAWRRARPPCVESDRASTSPAPTSSRGSAICCRHAAETLEIDLQPADAVQWAARNFAHGASKRKAGRVLASVCVDTTGKRQVLLAAQLRRPRHVQLGDERSLDLAGSKHDGDDPTPPTNRDRRAHARRRGSRTMRTVATTKPARHR